MGSPMFRVLALPALLLASPALAQEEIVVTGRGLAPAVGEDVYDVVRIGRERLVGSPSGRLDEILKEVPGFQLFRRSDARSANPTSQGATLRALGGNASSRALLILDGVPQSDPFGGWINWPAYDPERLGHQVRAAIGEVGAHPLVAGLGQADVVAPRVALVGEALDQPLVLEVMQPAQRRRRGHIGREAGVRHRHVEASGRRGLEVEQDIPRRLAEQPRLQVAGAAAAVAIIVFRDQPEQGAVGAKVVERRLGPVARRAAARDLAGQLEHLRAEQRQPPGQRTGIGRRRIGRAGPEVHLHDNLQLR